MEAFVAPSSPSISWYGYLSDLLSPESPLSYPQAIRVNGLWNSLWHHIGQELPPPYASPLEDGRFAMVWDRGNHHFELELLPEGGYEWFYMDRESTAQEGGEPPFGVFPPEMIQALKRTLL